MIALRGEAGRGGVVGRQCPGLAGFVGGGHWDTAPCGWWWWWRVGLSWCLLVRHWGLVRSV
jgi:hypothetical protein